MSGRPSSSFARARAAMAARAIARNARIDARPPRRSASRAPRAEGSRRAAEAARASPTPTWRSAPKGTRAPGSNRSGVDRGSDRCRRAAGPRRPTPPRRTDRRRACPSLRSRSSDGPRGAPPRAGPRTGRGRRARAPRAGSPGSTSAVELSPLLWLPPGRGARNPTYCGGSPRIHRRTTSLPVGSTVFGPFGGIFTMSVAIIRM